MKRIKVLFKFLFVLITIFALSFVLLNTNSKRVSAVEEEPSNFSETKFNISTDKNYVLLATAVKDTSLTYEVGYHIEGFEFNENDIHENNKVYSSITFPGQDPVTAKDIFGSEYDGWKMIVWELHFSSTTELNVKAYYINGVLVGDVLTKDETDEVVENDAKYVHVHDFGEGVVTTPATCTEKGVRTFTCECGRTKTSEIDALGHDYEFDRIEWTGVTAKAVYVCTNDSNHVEEYDCEVTSEVTTPVSPSADGVITYTATYDIHTDTKNVVIGRVEYTKAEWYGSDGIFIIYFKCPEGVSLPTSLTPSAALVSTLFDMSNTSVEINTATLVENCTKYKLTFTGTPHVGDTIVLKKGSRLFNGTSTFLPGYELAQDIEFVYNLGGWQENPTTPVEVTNIDWWGGITTLGLYFAAPTGTIQSGDINPSLDHFLQCIDTTNSSVSVTGISIATGGTKYKLTLSGTPQAGDIIVLKKGFQKYTYNTKCDLSSVLTDDICLVYNGSKFVVE